MPSFVVDKTVKKVPNVKLPAHYQASPFENLSNIFNPFGVKFGEIQARTALFNIVREPFKIPVPGEGLPRVINYCADQSGCAFWRMIWPGDELLAHNRAVVMTLYQMVGIAQFYLGIDAVKLQRQCTPEQLEFVKFLRNVS